MIIEAKSKHFLFPLIIALILVTLLLYFTPYRVGIVSGNSMDPTLHDGQVMLIARNYYPGHIFKRGDIVFFRTNGLLYVKRIYALPGDEVIQLHSEGAPDMIIGRVQADKAAKLIAAGYLKAKIIRIKVKPEHIFMIGDAMMNSIDSRDFGPVPYGNIVGKAIFLFEKKSFSTKIVNASIF